MAGPWEKYQQQNASSGGAQKPWEKYQSAPAQQEQPDQPSLLSNIVQGAGNLAAGAVRGAGEIGATILSPLDYAAQKLGIQNSIIGREDRRQAMTEGLQSLGAQPESLPFKVGEVGSEIAGTAGAGGLLARGATAAPKLAAALESGGFSLGAAPGATAAEKLANAGIRIGGGAASGATMAGMVNPNDVGAGAVLGGAIPVAGKVSGEIGSAIGKSMRASPQVAALAEKASNLGIDIPADRLTNSPILNAGAASLKYMPFSGRAAAETKMNDQIKTALSNTFGENTPHITKDLLAQAQTKLGGKFDNFLKNNTVTVDPQLSSDLQQNLATAQRELSPDNYRIVENQVQDLLGKVQNGQIDGQAAYNVKKTLDRLGRGNGNEAYHAREVRNSLMDALQRSVSPEDADAFNQLRGQYANLKDVQKLAGNNAEGDISMARLGNIDSKTPELNDISQIAATFAKGRESPHGAMQRVAMGSGVAALGGGAAAGLLVPVAAGLTAGRLANTALNSQALRNQILNQSASGNRLADLLSSPAGRAALVNYGSR